MSNPFYKRRRTGEQWQSGDGGNPPGLRPLAVGRYVFRWLSEGDRRRIKRAMRAADGRYEGEILFGLLAEVDTGVPILPGERITDEHIALFLEYLGIARIHSEMDEPMWRSIRQLCVGDDRADHLEDAYGFATGYEARILYDEKWEHLGIREMLQEQRAALIASGFDAPVAYARPALHRYPPDAPELNEPRQMSLFGDEKA